MKIEPFSQEFDQGDNSEVDTEFYRIVNVFKADIKEFVTEVYSKTKGPAYVSVSHDDKYWRAIRFFSLLPLGWYKDYLKTQHVEQYHVSGPDAFNGRYVSPLEDPSTVFHFEFGV